MVSLLTVGHGAQDRTQLTGLLRGAGVDVIVDVRRFPQSRTNPDVRQEALMQWLPQASISYRWEQRLGGRRHLPADAPKLDTWWTVSAFASYAAYTRTPEFITALDEVLEQARTAVVAVMCSESVWWRCHRRLIADVAVLGRSFDVQHLMPGGRLTPHRPAQGARLRDDGLLVWDLPAA